VADIEDQAVMRRVEDLVDGDGQLDHAEACAEMATCHRNSVDGFLAQFISQLPELLAREVARVCRCLDDVEKRCVRSHWTQQN
jgi:hypothetical protein